MKFTKKELETILIDVQSEEMVQSLVEMEYKHYLKCDYWKSVREVMHEMVGTECEICGNDLNIHIHHLNYDNRGKETLNDLVCLCGKCHSIVHKSHKGMFANEVFDRTQFIKQAEIVKKISKTFTNKYSQLLNEEYGN